METLVYGSVNDIGIEVINRDGRYFVRYDAGAHIEQWREDEITKDEVDGIEADGPKSNTTMFAIQKRLERTGVDPYTSNWKPCQNEEK